MEESRFLRQLDIAHPKKLQPPITIIGAGAIGSSLTLILAKMGCQNLTLYDQDKIEPQNLACQFFSSRDLGREKVGGVKDLACPPYRARLLCPRGKSFP